MVALVSPVMSDDVPTGDLSVNTDLVHLGVNSVVTWNVTYSEMPFDGERVTEDVTIYVSVFGVTL